MTRVGAHTNEVGRHELRKQTGWSYKSEQPPYNVSSLQGGNPIIAVSYKSVTLTGNFHPVYKSFRKATNYSRCVARLDSESSPGFLATTPSGAEYTYSGTDSRHSSGVTMSTTLGFSKTNGSVSCSYSTIQRATAEALNKVADQKINLAVTLAEAKKTVDWIAGKVLSLAEMIRLLRKRHYRALWAKLMKFRLLKKGATRVPKNTRTASSVWLEYWYAFMPLIYDISGAAQQLSEGFKEKDLLFKVERTVTNRLDPTPFIGSSSSRKYMYINGTAQESCKVTLWGSVKNNLHYLSQLGFINPAVVVWELVPYSFVIDWLIPIGDWLDSLTASTGVTFVDGHRVLRVIANVSGIRRTLSPTLSILEGGIYPSGRVRVYAMQRQVINDWPWAFPYWRNPLSSNHLVTALALLRQLRRG